MRHRALLILALEVLLVGCAASSPATPQRPTFSSDTSTTAPGTVEIEAGFVVDPRDSFDSPLSVKYGWSPTSEVFVGWSPHQWLETAGRDGRGSGDVVLGTRQRVREAGDGLPSFAVQLATKIPSASEREGLGSGEVDFAAAAIATQALGPATTTAFYQLGFLGEAAGDGTDLEHGLAVACGIPVLPEVSVFGELAGVLVHEEDQEELFATVGAAYAVTPELILDFAIVVGLSHDAPDFQVLFGFTRNLGRLLRGLRNGAGGAAPE